MTGQRRRDRPRDRLCWWCRTATSIGDTNFCSTSHRDLYMGGVRANVQPGGTAGYYQSKTQGGPSSAESVWR